jgi:hypothetical protein
VNVVASLIKVEDLRAKSSMLSWDEQFELASRIAANIGYRLVPELSIDMPPPRPEQVVERLVAVEALALELRERAERIERLYAAFKAEPVKDLKSCPPM